MQNSNNIKPKVFNLEERTYRFAKNIRDFIKSLDKKFENIDDYKQLVRSSGSIGANYIEANESLSKKDFLLRIRIARKEAKESKFWLRLIDTSTADVEKERARLEQEATELMMILSSIMRKYV